MTTRKRQAKDPLAFIPVPRKIARKDGWTPLKQRQFIAALAATGSVKAAAAQVAMAKEGAYALRIASGGNSFARAWDAALGIGVNRLADIAMERAIEGTAVPIMHAGVQVGEKRQYDNRLLTFMLRHYDPEKFGANPGLRPGTTGDARFFAEGAADYAAAQEAKASIRTKVLAARHLYQEGIADDPARTAAWDLLCGPADWPAIREGRFPRRETPWPMTDPATIIPVATGYLPGITSDDPARTAEERMTRFLRSIAENDPAVADDSAAAEAAGETLLTVEQATQQIFAHLATRNIDPRAFDDPEPPEEEDADKTAQQSDDGRDVGYGYYDDEHEAEGEDRDDGSEDE